MAQVIYTGSIPADGFVSVGIVNDGAPLAAGVEYTVTDEHAAILIARDTWQAAGPPAETTSKRRAPKPAPEPEGE